MAGDFHDIDGWFEFLEARMRVIESAVSKGYTPEQLEHLINVKGNQTKLLMLGAAENIAEGNANNG